MPDEDDEDSDVMVFEGGREIYSEVNDDDAEDISDADINFDKGLPTTHAYLGDDLEETSGRTILEEESWMEMAIYSMPGLVLMPGQTLPLHFYNDRDIAIIRHVLDKDKTFGQIDQVYEKMGQQIGTTMEVLAVKEEENVMKVKTIARQRFVMLSHRRDIGGVIIGKIKILPEIILPHPFENLYSPFALKSWNSKKFFDFTCSFTHWPSWVYKQYDVDELMREIRCELRDWSNSIDLSVNIDDSGQLNAVDFSYRVARVLSLDDEMKSRLLRISCPIQRLRFELGIIQNCASLYCRNCGAEMGHKEDMLMMSTEGTIGAYVNPGGHVHEVLTIHRATNILLHGAPSIQSTWFPGYAWTIGVCKECKRHVGWRFTAANDNASLSPARFWGLCRSSVSFKLRSGEQKFIPHI